MSKCLYCGGRKGKRQCPALGGLICSLCCGEHRMVRISCPSDCVYLDANVGYQQMRLGEQFGQDRRIFYKELFELGEDAAALFNLVEVVTFSYFQSRLDAADSEVIAALQSLRRTLSPLHIPAPQPLPFAEQLKKEYEAFRKQQPQGPIAGHGDTDVLDRALKFVTEFSGGGLQSNRFLKGLIGFIRSHHPEVAEQLAAQPEAGGRIILPGQFMPPVPEPHGHVHTHHHHHPH
jgi:hypothetical protein